MHGDNVILARFVGVSPAAISRRLNDKGRVSWALAKKLASATQTEPHLWMEATGADIRTAIEQSAAAGFGLLAGRRKNQAAPQG